ncbi:MAG: hypothetical protein NXI04_26090 [Planctomycetaceae bacterium]|nr:hypothetical protein [Planctomycetaceae bacterium]
MTQHDNLLPMDNAHASVFRCPGEPAPVSQSVHLARMASGWHGCRECVWNTSEAPAAGTGSEAEEESHDSRHTVDRNTGIRRTASGVRGAYLNAVDRFRAAQLASIFSTHLARVSQVRQSVRSEKAGVTGPAGVALAMGYDQRHGSQDLYAGVVSAVLQNGGDVYDLGECTCCSLLAFARHHRNVAGSLMVTGAGGSAGEVGLDAFDSDGRSLSVPWNDFGVGLRVPQMPAPADETAGVGIAQRLIGQFDRQTLTSLPATGRQDEQTSCLQLPDLADSTTLFRNGRSSGQLHSLSHEKDYLTWLQRWWPHHMAIRVGFDVATSRVEHRVMRLLPAESDAQFVSTAGDRTDHSGRMVIRISEDDRFATVITRQGRAMGADELADWINHSSRTTNSHVTAHPSQDGDHVLLVDVAGPDSGRSHEILSDGLAVAGLVLTLLQNEKNRLPR